MKAHVDILKQHGYAVHEKIGKGGQYYVYRAYEAGHGLCAVRVLRDLVDDPESLPTVVIDELKLAAKMRSSPYFAKLFKHFIEEQWLFTIWDYAENGTLAALIDRKNPLSREQCCKYLDTVAIGLDQLHQQNAVHGDIKPDNLLVYQNGFVKIGDLGIARLLTEYYEPLLVSNSSNTMMQLRIETMGEDRVRSYNEALEEKRKKVRLRCEWVLALVDGTTGKLKRTSTIHEETGRASTAIAPHWAICNT